MPKIDPDIQESISHQVNADPDLTDSLREIVQHVRDSPGEAREPDPRYQFRLTADILEGCGESLFGRNWKTEMAEMIAKGNSSRVRAMMTDKRPVPVAATETIVRRMQARISDLQDMIAEIEAARPDDVPSEIPDHVEAAE